MVKTIKIENFKSIQSLEIELGRVNIFIGENGCGKTNILEAITMGGALAADKLDNVFLLNRGVRVTEPRFMKSGFEKENEKDIFISFFSVVSESDDETGYPGEYSYFDCYLENFKNSKWADSRWGDNNRLEAMLERLHYRDNASKILRIDDFQVFCPENYILRKYESESHIGNLGVNGEGLLGMLEKLYLENKLNEIKENLALIDWFYDFEIVYDAFRGSYLRIKDRFLNEEMTYSSFKSVNEGFLFLLFYLTLFISEYTPKFFAIDNIDNALNPKLGMRLIKVLAELAQKHEKQVIMTTHNPAILDGLNLNDDEQRLFAIYRNADGHTKAKRILKPEVPNGVEPARMSELFLRGAIGGIPKNF